MNFILSIFIFINSLFSNTVTVTSAPIPVNVQSTPVATTSIAVNIPAEIIQPQIIEPLVNNDNLVSSDTPLVLPPPPPTPVLVPQQISIPVYITLPQPPPVQPQVVLPPTVQETVPEVLPLPAPQFVGVPTTTIQHNETTNNITIDWYTDIPTTSTFNLCIGTEVPSQCTVQETLNSNTFHEYSILRPANAAELYSIGITANGQTTWYLNPLPQ